MFLLVPAHPGFPGQIPQSRKTVVCVCVLLLQFNGVFSRTTWVKKCKEYKLEGSRPRGRPTKTWRGVVQKDCQACKFNREDAMDHR